MNLTLRNLRKLRRVTYAPYIPTHKSQGLAWRRVALIRHHPDLTHAK